MGASSVIFVFLLLCCLQMMLVSMPTCMLPGKVVQNTSILLRGLGDLSPAHCRRYKTQIQFPESALSDHAQCGWTAAVVYAALQGAGLLFEDLDLPGGPGGPLWDEQKLDHYLNLQYRLLDEHACLNSTRASAVLTSYFSSVQEVLQQQEGAVCGWQALRRDVCWVLKTALRRHHACFSWPRPH